MLTNTVETWRRNDPIIYKDWVTRVCIVALCLSVSTLHCVVWSSGSGHAHVFLLLLDMFLLSVKAAHSICLFGLFGWSLIQMNQRSLIRREKCRNICEVMLIVDIVVESNLNSWCLGEMKTVLNIDKKQPVSQLCVRATLLELLTIQYSRRHCPGVNSLIVLIWFS